MDGVSGGQVYVFDRMVNSIELVSQSTASAAGNSSSDYPAINSDGQYIAFQSHADNFVAGDTEGKIDIFVRDRAGDHCEYCRLPQAAAPAFTFHVEHIRARQHGGSDDLSNLALACPDCNRRKGPNLSGIDAESQQLVPLFNPRIHSWEEHFRMQGSWIRGLTATGRATVELLDMNNDERVEMRGELHNAGGI